MIRFSMVLVSLWLPVGASAYVLRAHGEDWSACMRSLAYRTLDCTHYDRLKLVGRPGWSYARPARVPADWYTFNAVDAHGASYSITMLASWDSRLKSCLVVWRDNTDSFVVKNAAGETVVLNGLRDNRSHDIDFDWYRCR